MDRSRGSDSKSTKVSPRKKTSMSDSRKDDIIDGVHPNASEEEQASPTKSMSFNTLVLSDSKEHLSPSGKTGKSRTKSPSFFKMLVNRGLRKISTNELEDPDGITRSVVAAGGDSSSFSDNDDPISFSPIVSDNERRRIDHIATLPRRNNDFKRQNNNGERVTRSFSDEQCCLSSHDDKGSFDQMKEKQIEGEDQIDTDCYQDAIQTTPTTQFTDYHSVGLEALEMLHNQLQILVIQDCDSDMADLMPDQVTDSLKKQILDLQDSLSYFQQSDQNLRLLLKIAEMRAQEAETKLHHSSQRGLRMEERYYRLEMEYNKMYQNYCTIEKHLQKQAVLHQMQLSPNKKFERRPNSASNNRRQKSFDSPHSPRMNPVKRHNSSEYLSHHQRHKSSTKSIDHTTTPTLATAEINPCSTLPTRLHSGSLSHTETRV